MNWKPVVAAALLVASSVGAGAVAASGTQQGSAYAGTYVEFETKSNAVVDYAVADTVIVEEMKVQSESKAESSGSVRAGVGLKSVTGIAGSAVSMNAKAETHATVTTESGAELEANDNDRGVVVVRAGGSSQYVQANVSADAEAESEGENRVVVTKESGESGTFIVVGDGNVTVNEEGNVVANLGSDARLVYRQYAGERSDSEERQERLIANGTAVAEVYYQSAAESGSDGGDDAENRTANVVSYSEDTTVEVTQKSEGKLTYTAERSASEGKVVITSVSEQAFGSAEDIEVTVDGEAAAQAESYSAVKAATEGGEQSKYIVRQSSSAQASTDVIVGINHFSEREVTMTSGDAGGDSGGDSGGDASPTSGNGPGFGIAAALVALAGGALAATRGA